jgi:hypothetical protein
MKRPAIPERRRAATAAPSTFRAVPPGSYTVKIALQGFGTHEQKKNVVNASNF